MPRNGRGGIVRGQKKNPPMFEDRGVVYTVEITITEAELDSLIQGNCPARVADQLLSAQCLGELLGMRARMQLDPGDLMRMDAERRYYHAYPDGRARGVA